MTPAEFALQFVAHHAALRNAGGELALARLRYRQAVATLQTMRAGAEFIVDGQVGT